MHVTLSDKEEYWENTKHLIYQLQQSSITYKPLLLSPTKHYTPVYGDTFRQQFDAILQNTGKNTSGGDFFKTLKIEYEDGSVELCPDYDVELRGLNKFKGYNCKAASYSSNMDGSITNTCSGTAVPLSMTGLGDILKCPLELCPGRRLMQFEKTHELYTPTTH